MGFFRKQPYNKDKSLFHPIASKINLIEPYMYICIIMHYSIGPPVCVIRPNSSVVTSAPNARQRPQGAPDQRVYTRQAAGVGHGDSHGDSPGDGCMGNSRQDSGFFSQVSVYSAQFNFANAFCGIRCVAL